MKIVRSHPSSGVFNRLFLKSSGLDFDVRSIPSRISNATDGFATLMNQPPPATITHRASLFELQLDQSTDILKEPVGRPPALVARPTPLTSIEPDSRHSRTVPHDYGSRFRSKSRTWVSNLSLSNKPKIELSHPTYAFPFD